MKFIEFVIDMSKVDFSNIADKYEGYSSVQKSAAEVLLKLLEIGGNEDVLDLGCGVGSLTRRIREITKGKVFSLTSKSPGFFLKEKMNMLNYLRNTALE